MKGRKGEQEGGATEGSAGSSVFKSPDLSTPALPCPALPRASSGARDPAATLALVSVAEHETKQKLETDAMFRLEHGEADRGTLQRALPTLSHLQEAQNVWKDDFALNSLLRRRFRVRGRGGRGPRHSLWQKKKKKKNLKPAGAHYLPL